MTALFVALGIMVLALLALLLWFVPHLLQQQATRVAGETAQLREMLLDLLNEQETVTIRQTQLGSSLSHLQDKIETLAQVGDTAANLGRNAVVNTEHGIQHLEVRLGELQSQIQGWMDGRQQGAQARTAQDNEFLGLPDEFAGGDLGSRRHALTRSGQCSGWIARPDAARRA